MLHISRLVMPSVDGNLPIFRQKNMKVLEQGFEKIEVHPQEGKEGAQNINELRGKSAYLNEVGYLKIRIYGKKLPHSDYRTNGPVLV